MKINRQATDTAVLTEIGLRLARLRLEQNFTQVQLAEQAGVSKSALIKRGRTETIVHEVCAAVKKWPAAAGQAGVAKDWRKVIRQNHRLDWPANS